MNSYNSTIYKKIRCFDKICKHRLINWGISSCLALSLFVVSCADEAIISENNVQSHVVGNIKVTNLPAYLGISLNQNDSQSTRADEGVSFDDGLTSEYALAAPDGVEYLHYLVVYGSQSSPMVFPLDITEEDVSFDNNKYSNVTLTISKVLTGTRDLGGNFDWNSVTSGKSLSKVFENAEAYVLLNFKLIDNKNYNLDGAPITGSNTPEKLLNLSKADLQRLQMTDYGIHITKISSGEDGSSGSVSTPVTYLTMTNSVYSDGNNKLMDSGVNTDKIYSSLEAAKADPAISIYVERLASKVSVSFNTAEMATTQFGPVGEQFDQTVTIGNDGFPVISTTVYKVDVDGTTNKDGISFEENGYKIKKEKKGATIKIIGFGLSNLENSMRLFKDINAFYGTEWIWYDKNLHRSYWATDQHCALARTSNAFGTFKKVNGYPHQFRLALDTDSVTSYHNGSLYTDGADNGYNYEAGKPVIETYKIGDVEYQSFAQLGEIDVTKKIEGVFLNYKSYETLENEFEGANLRYQVSGRKVTFDPLYTLENTYYDQGMLTNGTWRWPWHRAPYATATNLIVMAQITLSEVNQGEPTTLYLGQNNIFYVKKTNLLRSKLAILNQVMLSGGNAGLQILHGQWDSHTRWDDGTNHSADETHLDKIAWNEGSVLWFAEVEMKDEEGENGEIKQVPDYEEIDTGKKDEKGDPIITYSVKLKEVWQADVHNDETALPDEQDLDLIPAEISGGDGQCLIAPNRKYMGAKYRYYLGPAIDGKDSEGNNIKVMDRDKAVEISYNHLVALIHKIIGPVDVYTDGLMYYSVPIPHRYLSYGPNSNTNIWKIFGGFSMVRNNWYNITVNQISKIGTPVHDLSQPIVPVMDVKRSYLNMGIELKDYHDITQDNIPIL